MAAPACVHLARDGASRAKAPRPIEEWRIVVKGRYPAYVDWPTYEMIRSVIRDNRAEYMRNKTRGAPRDGDLLLHGITWCARCGHKMYVRYKGGGQYVCNHLRSNEGLPACQYIRAARVDAVVADAFLTALAPAELEALSRARRAQQQVDTALRTSAERQLERKRYAAALAERQFNRVDPDNRLVAAELERRWEEALSEARAAEEALVQQSSPQAIGQMGIGKVLHGKVVHLAGRLPQIWEDPATTDAQRKALLRCVVDKVVLDRGEHDVAQVRIVWRGGAVTNLEVKVRVNSVLKLTRGTEMRDRVLDLARNGLPDDEIAATLTGEGHRSPNCENMVLPITVGQIRRGAGIRVTEPRTRWSHETGLLSAPQLAARLNIPVNWIYVQIRQKRLLIDRQPTGAYLFQDTTAVLDAVRNLRNHTINRLDLRICQPHKEGHSTCMIEHIAELCGGDRDNTISRRRPDEPATFQTLGVQRHPQAVMPKNFQQVAALAAKHVEIASMRIAMQRLLNLQCQAVHATAHVRRTRGQPHPHTRWWRYHPRSTVTTRRSVARLISCPTLIDVPSGSVISILLSATAAWRSVTLAAPHAGSVPCSLFTDHPHRDKYRLRLRPQNATANQTSPVPQQSSADLIPPGNLGDAGAWLLGLSDNPQLLRSAPTSSPFNPGDDLHPARCL